MKKTTHLKFLITLLAFALTLSACNLPSTSSADQVALSVAQTQIAQTQTALAAGEGEASPGTEADAPQPPPEPSPTFTITPSPSETHTPTLSVPMVSVSRSTNCRTGPGEPYEIVGKLLENEEAEVVGISSYGDTWIIKNPDGGGECWLWGYYASVVGPVEGLPVHTPPPTPTPQFTWAGDWNTANYPLGGMGVVLTMTITVDDKAFSAVMSDGMGDPMLLSGTISDDNLTVSGTWTFPGHSGTFKFFALGTDQFQGSRRNAELWQWCGGRDGASLPDPCLKE